MLNPKHSAKYVCRTGTSASSIARADTSHEMIRQKTRSTSSQFLISFLFPTSRYGKKEGDQDYHTANQLQKKCKKREFLSIHDRFIRDARFRKTMLELGRTEEVIREMDKLANEDHTHIATEEELNVYRSNWSMNASAPCHTFDVGSHAPHGSSVFLSLISSA